MIVVVAVLGWLLAFTIIALAVTLTAPSRPDDEPIEALVSEPLSQAESWDLGLPWYDPEINRLTYPPTDWSVEGPDADVHAQLHAAREAAELDPEAVAERAHASIRGLHLTLTREDIVYLAGAWLHSASSPDAGSTIHLPSGRVLSGTEAAQFIWWLRWREGSK